MLGVAESAVQNSIWRKYMRKLATGFAAVLMAAAFSVASVSADPPLDVATIAAGATVGDVSSTAAFTAGAGSTVNGYVVAAQAVTLGASVTVTGNVSAGAAFTSGDSAKI